MSESLRKIKEDNKRTLTPSQSTFPRSFKLFNKYKYFYFIESFSRFHF